MLPSLAVLRRCIRVLLHRSLLPCTADRARSIERRLDIAEAFLLRMHTTIAFSRILVNDTTALTGLAARRTIRVIRRVTVGRADPTRPVQRRRQSTFWADMWCWPAGRSPPHSHLTLHFRQQHSRAHALHAALLFRHPAASRARAALQGRARQYGGQRVGGCSARRRRHQPRTRRLRGGRVRTSRTQPPAAAGAGGTREHPHAVVPRRRDGARPLRSAGEALSDGVQSPTGADCDHKVVIVGPIEYQTAHRHFQRCSLRRDSATVNIRTNSMCIIKHTTRYKLFLFDLLTQ